MIVTRLQCFTVDSFVVEILSPMYIELPVFIVMFSRLAAIFGSSLLARPYSLRHSSARLAATIAFVVRLRPSNSASYVIDKISVTSYTTIESDDKFQ